MDKRRVDLNVRHLTPAGYRGRSDTSEGNVEAARLPLRGKQWSIVYFQKKIMKTVKSKDVFEKWENNNEHSVIVNNHVK